MNEDILNDEKVIGELNEKLNQYETKLKGYEDKKNELRATLSDLDKKTFIEGISDSTKEKIEEVMNKVKDKINEIETQTEDLNNKIKEINETLNPKPESETPKAPEIQEILEVLEVPEISEKIEEENIMTEREEKIRKLEDKRSELETKRSRKETDRSSLETKRSEIETNRNTGDNEFIAQIDAQVAIIEKQKHRLAETAGNIDAKIDDENINEATRERLEEMRDEVQEKIDEFDEKIDELQEKIDEYWDEMIDGINDKIDEMNDEIDELNDEIEEICDEIEDLNGTVDEDVINEVKKSSGFDGIGNLLNSITDSVNAALKNVNKSINVNIPKIPDIKIPDIHIPEINIPKLNIRIPEQNYSFDKSERNPKNKSQGEKYNVNFCSNKAGAKIFAVCCEHQSWNCHAEQCIDNTLDSNWYGTENHGNAKIVRPHWVIVDFGEVKTFNYLKLVKCSAGHGHPSDTGNKSWDASAWRFEVSSDREHWVEFNRETDDKSAIYEKSFGTLTGRYVRLLVDAGGSDPNNKRHGVRLYDLRLEMRGENGESVNLCKDAGIEVCCRVNWGDVNWGNDKNQGNPRHLIDNDPDYKTKWYAEDAHEENTAQPHWLIIDMGQPRTFNHMKIAKASEGKNDFGHTERDMSAWRVEVSGDRVNWKEFNKETNDHSPIYEKTFDTQTGRYIRLWVDAAGSDPNNKNAPVILYNLCVDMVDRGEKSEEVTFEDIASIAPFASKETLDKLVDKFAKTDDLSKIKKLAPFLSKETLDKLITRASDKADFDTIKSLAPFLDRSTLDRLVEELNEDMDFEKIKSLAPFLSRETLEKCVTRGGTKLDMKRLRSLAPFLGADYIDEIISKML